MTNKSSRAHGIALKKEHGQHFLRDEHIVWRIVGALPLTSATSVLEIGCGDGFLTRVIMQTPIARLWVFEIDPAWAAYVQKQIADPRLSVFCQDFLTVSIDRLEAYKPWTVLANLPYHITFPILHKLQQNPSIFVQGVIMVQEEVAQKIVKTHGKDYGFVSLFFQRYFEWQLLDKVPPSAFEPPPKVFSRLLQFKARVNIPPIECEQEFWQFIRICFKQPRRTLLNNLKNSAYSPKLLDPALLAMRAQQLRMDDFLHIWQTVLSVQRQ